MKLQKLMEQWGGGYATLRHQGGLVLHVYPNGAIDFGEHYVQPETLFDDGWRIEYPIDFDTERLIRALIPLNQDCGELLRSEWNSWCEDHAAKVVFAVARALGFSIKGLVREK